MKRKPLQGTHANMRGSAGEDAAERTYTDAGAKVLARRFRCAEGEIDLILEQNGILIFVEVKARATIEAASGAVKPAQWMRIMTAAEVWLSQQGLGLDTPMRFDLVAANRQGQFEVFENATQGLAF